MQNILVTHIRYVGLIKQLIRRDIDAKFKGAFLGMLWSLATPLFTLAMYTLVFGSFMRARWPGANGSADFALILFPGLIIFGFFSDCLNRAPTLITSHPNFVKKVVFPVELLVWIPMGSALFGLLLSLVAWASISLIVGAQIHWSILFLPLVLLPLVLVVLGASWFLSGLGVYVRDAAHITPVITQTMMFLSPVLYPLENVPQKFVWIIMLNPLTFVVEQARIIMIKGQLPDFVGIGIYIAIGIVVCALGNWFFAKVRPGFADIV